MDENPIFSDIKFFIAQCNDADEIKQILIDGGAQQKDYLLENVTHVISDQNCPDVEEAVDIYDKPVVTSLWVYLSLKAKKLMPTAAFSPIKSIFHNVVASFSKDLSSHDVDILASTLTFYGSRVTKDVVSATHFIVAKANSSDIPDNPASLKIVAPDWVQESIKLNNRCDELLFDPNSLLGPPPPPPPTPPPKPPTPPQSIPELISNETEKESTIWQKPTQLDTLINETRQQTPQVSLNNTQHQQQVTINHSNKQVVLNQPQQHQQVPNQLPQQHQLQQQPLQPQQPQQQQQQQPQQMMVNQSQPQHQQVMINQPPHHQHQPIMMNQHQQIIVNQAQHQQHQHQQILINQPQPQHHQQVMMSQSQQQPPQMMNRFQDPNTNLNQRPYQVCLQPQTVNSSYQQNNMYRQPMYYARNTNQMQVRLPQQGAPIRQIQNKQIVYKNFNPMHPQQQQSSPALPQHYQGPHVPQQQPFQHVQPQHQQQLKQPQPPSIQTRPQYQPNFSAVGPSVIHTRPVRTLFNNQQDPKINSVRAANPPPPPPQVVVNHGKGPRMPNSSPLKPYPSIFDHIQESNLAQIKAKVPIVAETFDYYGHNPKENVPKDLPLIGCKFKFIDYEEVNPKLKAKWFDAIKIAGGTFDDNLNQITHLLCENRLSTTYSEALKLGVRCVTIYWVNDILANNHLSYPWKALHLPLPFAKDNRPLNDQIITITNFKGRQRREVKEMIIKTSAKYTEYLSPGNSLIICGNVGGEKYERAIEWRIPITNCQLLSDILLKSDRDISSMLTQTKYQLFNPSDPLKLSSYLDIYDLMKPWMKPVTISEHQVQEKNCSVNGVKNHTITAPDTKTEDSDEIATDPCELTESNTSSSSALLLRTSRKPVRLLFTHLRADLLEQLKLYSRELVLGLAASPVNCTHLIVDRISRTPKFICAFSHANYILSYKWIIESHKAGNLLDERHFILQDKSGEEKYSFNLVYSLLKRKKRTGLLFTNIVFFITPTVLQDVSNVKEMIESAGGVVATKKPPTKLQVDQLRSNGKRLVVVTSNTDLHLCSIFKTYNVDIVNVEFVISGILRQDLDFDAHRLLSTSIT